MTNLRAWRPRPASGTPCSCQSSVVSAEGGPHCESEAPRARPTTDFFTLCLFQIYCVSSAVLECLLPHPPPPPDPSFAHLRVCLPPSPALTRVRSMAVRNEPRKGTAGQGTVPLETKSRMLLYMPLPGSAKRAISPSNSSTSSESARRRAVHVFFSRLTWERSVGYRLALVMVQLTHE